jgi:alpha-L-rhamnosidase
VGMVTVMWLVRALGEADEGEPLIDLYTNAGQPGWARCLSRGATATWESWDADEDGQSESHAWGAAGLDGYVRYILGVKPLRPQYEVVQIKPLSFGAKLASAKGTLPTDRGDISVEWQRTGDRFVLKVILPANVTATVCVPKGAAADSLVQVDGAPLTATAAGNYLSLAGVGSGAHTFVRRFSPP